jgi:hypothetical protein
MPRGRTNSPLIFESLIQIVVDWLRCVTRRARRTPPAAAHRRYAGCSCRPGAVASLAAARLLAPLYGLVAAATRTHEAQARRHTRRHPDQRDGPPAAASPHARRPPAAATYRRGVRSSSARPQLATTLASAARRRTLRATLLTANSAATPQGTLAAGLPRLAAGRGGFPPAVRSP